MSNYKRFMKLLTTSDQDVLVCGAGAEQAANSILFSNSSGSAVVATVTVAGYAEGADFATGYVTVPANGTAPWPSKLHLNAGDKIKAKAATGSVITMTGAYLEDAGTAPVAQGFTPKGAYSAGTTYAVNDVVSSGGKAYASIVGSNVGNAPASSPTQWLLLTDPSAMGLVLSTRAIAAAGLATGGGDLSADRTITVPAAVASDVRTGTDTTKATTAGAITGSAAFITLTDAATIAWDVNNGYNATVILGGNRLIGAPTNLKDGVTYTLEPVQDATGSRVPSWHSIWDFGAAGLPTLQTGANKADKVFAQYNARTGKLDANFRKGA